MKKLVILALAFVMTLAFASFSFALKKDIEFATCGDEGKVMFSHEIHTEKNKLGCKDCHPAIFQMKKGADKPTMKEMEEGKNCGACHNGTKAFSVKDKEKCGNCHKK
jgi:c(7)-type cytochrome triheme protein